MVPEMKTYPWGKEMIQSCGEEALVRTVGLYKLYDDRAGIQEGCTVSEQPHEGHTVSEQHAERSYGR